MSRIAWLVAVVVSLLPSPIKKAVYRWCYGYTIARSVTIGFGTLFVGVRRCCIGPQARIGPGNVFCHVERVDVGEAARIGPLNLFRGGRLLEIGPYAAVFRCNVFNSIRFPNALNPHRPECRVGRGAVITTGHWLDYTDHLEIGEQVVIGGRNSSFWTHSRQRTRPIVLGAHCYLGSEVRVAPGVELPPRCLVALGAVLRRSFTEPGWLIGGNPATAVQRLSPRDLYYVTGKTRPEIPDDDADELVESPSQRGTR